LTGEITGDRRYDEPPDVWRPARGLCIGPLIMQ
jgi:hypothetical protein